MPFNPKLLGAIDYGPTRAEESKLTPFTDIANYRMKRRKDEMDLARVQQALEEAGFDFDVKRRTDMRSEGVRSARQKGIQFDQYGNEMIPEDARPTLMNLADYDPDAALAYSRHMRSEGVRSARQKGIQFDQYGNEMIPEDARPTLMNLADYDPDAALAYSRQIRARREQQGKDYTDIFSGATEESLPQARERAEQFGVPNAPLTAAQIPRTSQAYLPEATKYARAVKAEEMAMEKRKNESDADYKNRMASAAWANAMTGRQNAENKPPAPSPLTYGEKALDVAFAKDNQDFMSGGFADAQKNLAQLEGVKERLKAGKEGLTGPFVGLVPDVIRRFTHPEALDVRDQVEEVVQRNLRLILGAQFTQREGERLIARSFNPALPEALNAKRLERLTLQMKRALEARMEQADYFQKHGTLKGFDQSKLTRAMTDLLNPDGPNGAPPPGPQPPALTDLLNPDGPNGAPPPGPQPPALTGKKPLTPQELAIKRAELKALKEKAVQ